MRVLIMPDYTQTDRVNQLAAAAAGQSGKSVKEAIAYLGGPVPGGRVGQPAEFGAPVAFSASKELNTSTVVLCR